MNDAVSAAEAKQEVDAVARPAPWEALAPAGDLPCRSSHAVLFDGRVEFLERREVGGDGIEPPTSWV
jgi:hypothetical protein